MKVNQNYRFKKVASYGMLLLLTVQPAIAQVPFKNEADWRSRDHFTLSVAWGDVDGDGDLDLACGNAPFEGELGRNTLYLNNNGILEDNPSWISEQNYTTRSVAWGDVDGDGDLDLACDNNGDSVAIYLNQNGVLDAKPSQNLATASATSLAFGDVDNDGDLDLAVGNSGVEGEVDVLYLNQNGIFEDAPSWKSQLDLKTTSVAWGDIDNDGDLDLVTGSARLPTLLYLNDNGLLATKPSWFSESDDATNSVALGDVNGDGYLDLACGNSGFNHVYINRNGMFEESPSWTSALQHTTQSVAWGDIDGDGDLDLVCANSDNDQENTIYLNVDGRLKTTPDWSAGKNFYTFDVALGDADGDGDLDLAFGSNGNFGGHAQPGPITLFLNNSVFMAKTPSWSPGHGENAWSVAWGDVDDDGDLDLAVGNNGAPNAIYRNENNILESTPFWVSEPADGTVSVAWGDIDGDGDLDLACGNLGQPNTVYRNNDGILETQPFWISDSSRYTLQTRSVAWGDMNGDGLLDLACGNSFDSFRNTSLPNVVYLNINGTLSEQPVWFSAPNYDTRSVAWGDVDGDGDLDLACGNNDQKTLVYRNVNGMLERIPYWESQDENSANSVAWGDMNGDGFLDLAVSNQAPRPSLVYLNTDGTLEKNPHWSADPFGGLNQHVNTNSLAWGDIDGDGDLDLVCGNQGNEFQMQSALTIYLNRAGILETKPSWSAELYSLARDIALGDLDGDGDLDLASTHTFANDNLYIHLNHSNRSDFAKLPNNPAYISSLKQSQLDLNANTLSFRYTLVDDEKDFCNIIAQYSPVGGGKWFQATEGPGSDGSVNLAADAVGIDHTFEWNLRADDVAGTDILFRLQVLSQSDRAGLMQRPFTNFQFPIRIIDTPPFMDIFFPTTGQNIGGEMPIIGRVWDNFNFGQFDIKIDNNVLFQSDIPHSNPTELFLLNSDEIASGEKILRITARDKSNKQRITEIPINLVSLPDKPKVDIKYPANRSDNVPVNSPIIVQFNTKMNPASLSGNSLIVFDANRRQIPGSVIYNFQTNALVFVPDSPLERASFYVVTVDQDFQDKAGVPLAATSVWSFTTEFYLFPPDDIETTPANGLIGVPVADSIKVRLDLNSPYKFISVRDLAGHAVEPDKILTVTHAFEHKKEIIFVPEAGFSGSTLYLVTLYVDTLNQQFGSYRFYFITEDVETLQIARFNPSDGETISPLNFEISATFNKDMNPNTLDSTAVFLLRDGAKVPAIVTYSVEEKKVLVTPQGGLTPNESYTVHIMPKVKSEAGLDLGQEFIWQFHTSSIMTPAGGAVRSLDRLVELEFPPNAIADDVPIIIQKVSDDLARFNPRNPGQRILGNPYSFKAEQSNFAKPVTMRMKIVITDSLANLDDKLLAIYGWIDDNAGWMRIGGTVRHDGGMISLTTVIKQLHSHYAILEDKSTEQLASRTLALTNVTSQPRVFSPQGGGFNTQTAISFELGKETNVTIKIYNAAGRLVRVLTENEPMPYGTQVKYWDGKDQSGHYCLSGLHLVTIQAEDKMVTKTVVVLNK